MPLIGEQEIVEQGKGCLPHRRKRGGILPATNNSLSLGVDPGSTTGLAVVRRAVRKHQ